YGMVAVLCCALCAAGGYFAGSKMWVQRQVTQAAQAMSGMPGVTVNAVGGTVMLTGHVESMPEYQKARMLVRAMNAGKHGVKAVNQLQVSEDAKTEFLAQLRRDLHNRKVRPRFLGNRLVLE